MLEGWMWVINCWEELNVDCAFSLSHGYLDE